MERIVYDFETFCLDPEERRLLRNGEPVSIGPKIFDLLVLLVEQAGQTMARDILVETLWGEDTWADNANVNQAIWLLRKALAPMGSELVETVPKKGYRFKGAVTQRVVEAPSSDVISGAVAALEPEEPARRVPRLLIAAVVVAVAVVVVASILLWLLAGKQQSTEGTGGASVRVRVAVLDFENLSEEESFDWIAGALAHMLTMEVSSGGDLEPVSRQEVNRARHELALGSPGVLTPAQLQMLHDAVGADAVVSGSYRVLEDGDESIRIDVQVRETRAGSTLLSLSRTEALPHISRLAAGVVEEMRRRLPAGNAGATPIPELLR